MELLNAAVILMISTIFLLFGLLRKPKKHLTGLVAPGPRNLPIIGSIHHLLGRRLPHHALRDLSAIYGPIMRLKLGEINAIVISSPEAAKQIMQTHDIIFASRPITPIVDALFYGGKGIVFAQYGEYWRQMRRLCFMELLNSKRVHYFRAVREQEVFHLIQSIATAPPGFIINLRSELANFVTKIMVISVIGGRCEDQKVFLSALDEVIDLNMGFSVVDMFPSMPNFITRIAGIRWNLVRCHLKLDLLGEKIIQEHNEKRAKHSSMEEEDLTDVLLRIQKDGALKFPLPNDDIKAIINDILIAGSETTWTTLEWAISELVCNPTIMKKAQKEVREVFGYGMTKIIEDDKLLSDKLSYLQMVIKETLRLHTPLPFLLPRVNKERCEVMGYDIPTRTTVLVNAWAIARDPKYWDQPEVFRPERFEEDHVDMKGANFEMMPFGVGRRICPGIHFGMATVEMALAHLLYYFDWRYPTKNGEELNMTEALGVSTRRKSPLCLLATPCIPLPDA